MSDGTGLAEALLGQDGFRVLDVREGIDELVSTVESTVTVAWCAACETRAEAHERKAVELRDLRCFGRPARLVWVNRRWRCIEEACDAKTWTECSEHVDAQAVMVASPGRATRHHPASEHTSDALPTETRRAVYVAGVGVRGAVVSVAEAGRADANLVRLVNADGALTGGVGLW